MKVPLVIAHRGASGYLPEHSLPAKALAYAQGADYLEQDVVSTRDGVPIVFHDLTLDATTDVGAHFPGCDRARADGLHYCIDFDFAEIRELSLLERSGEDGNPRFAGRFPRIDLGLRIPSLHEELSFIRGLNQTSGRAVGVYPEIKHPEFHRQAGIELTNLVLGVLDEFGYLQGDAQCFLQCFDAGELRQVRARARDLSLIQLLSAAPGAGELERIAAYAQGVGPALDDLYTVSGEQVVSNGVREAAGQAGLLVHPYTLREDALPKGVADFDALLRLCAVTLAVDGVFTDFPDLAVDGFRQLR